MAKKKTLSRRDMLLKPLDTLRKRLPDPGFEPEPEPMSPARAAEAELLAAADAALAEGRLDEAIVGYQEFVRSHIGRSDIRARLGYALYARGKWIQAGVELTRALKQGKHKLAALYLGLACARRGDLDKARKAWAEYFNPEEPLIQREINVQLALLDSGDDLTPDAVADAIEAAIAATRRDLFKDSESGAA